MPVDKSSWKKLHSADSEIFIKTVASQGEPYVFNEKASDVLQIPLPFYQDYHLVRILNKSMLPYLILDYLSNGTHHLYLDGSDAAFHHLNAIDSFSLRADNVADYVDLYISYVYERGNSLELAPNTVPIVTQTAEGFDLSLQLKFQERIVDGMISVSNNGVIHIKAPVNVCFLDTLNTEKTPQYRHPLENQIKEQIEGLASITETGMAALQKMHSLQVDLRILTSPAYQTFCTDSKTAYITMPATEQNAKYTQVLDFVSVIKDIELSLEEQRYRPSPYQTSAALQTEATGLHLAKNLESILEMCKIVKELEEQNIPEALYALKNSGLYGIYQGFEKNHSKNVLLGIYRNEIISFLEEN